MAAVELSRSSLPQASHGGRARAAAAVVAVASEGRWSPRQQLASRREPYAPATRAATAAYRLPAPYRIGYADNSDNRTSSSTPSVNEIMRKGGGHQRRQIHRFEEIKAEEVALREEWSNTLGETVSVGSNSR